MPKKHWVSNSGSGLTESRKKRCRKQPTKPCADQRLTQHYDKISSQRIEVERYEYGPALQSGQIRLLKLAIGNGGDAVTCEVLVSPVGDLEYHALSYTWGSPVPTHELTCNGKLLPIAKNLHAMLRSLRQEYGDMYLWADAVCINQANTDERTDQVRRMSEIYREATTVVIWLGEENHNARAGIQLLSKLCVAFPSSNGEGIKNLFLDENVLQVPADVTGMAKLGLPDTTSEVWRFAGEIVERMWFTRRWVLQEILNASACSFRIGSIQTTPDLILGGIFRILAFPELRFVLNTKQRTIGNCVDNMVQLLRRGHKSFSHESLAELLLETALFESSDARDKVFAIIGCFEDPPKLLVDYKKTLAQLVKDVATCEPDRDESVLTLFRGLCHIDDLSSDPDIPSWVPSWKFSTPFFMPLSHDEDDSNVDPEQASMVISANNVLESGAIFFDHVGVYADTYNFRDSLPFQDQDLKTQRKALIDALREKCDWLMQCRQAAEDASGSAPIDLEAYLECHLFGSVPEGLDTIASYEAGMRSNAFQFAHQETTSTQDLIRRYAELCRDFSCPEDPKFEACSTVKELNDYAADLEARGEFHRINPRKRYGRQFFATETGRLGWIPQASESGDEICVLAGYAMPFVVRKIVDEDGKESGTYRFIGACYVHGFMDGEVFLDDTLPRTSIYIS